MLVSSITLFVSFGIMCVLLAIQSYSKARKTPCTFVWGGLFIVLFIVFPLLLNVFAGYAIGIRGDRISDDAVYIIYAFSILTSVLGYSFVVFYLSPKRPIGAPAEDISSRLRPNFEKARQVERFVYYFSGALVIAGFATFVHGTGMSIIELFVATRFEWLTQETGATLNIGLYLMGLAAVFSFYDAKFGMPRKWMSLVVYCTVLSMVLLAGGRKWVLFVASGVLAGYFDRAGGTLPITKKLVMSIILLGFVVTAWQVGRAIPWKSVKSLDAAYYEFKERVPRLINEGDATYFYRASLESIRLNRDAGLTYPFAVVRRIVFLPIPSDWTMGLKPEGIPFLFADEIGAGTKIRRGNQPPGLIGLFVLSFGWVAAVVLLPLLTVLPVRALDRFVCERVGLARDTMWATFAVAVVLLMRGSTGGFYFLASNLLAVSCLAFGYYALRDLVGNATRLRQPKS